MSILNLNERELAVLFDRKPGSAGQSCILGHVELIKHIQQCLWTALTTDGPSDGDARKYLNKAHKANDASSC